MDDKEDWECRCLRWERTVENLLVEIMGETNNEGFQILSGADEIASVFNKVIKNIDECKKGNGAVRLYIPEYIKNSEG
ncbi:MAG: hypothetical protein GY841_16180 [FCB group bacterium]|nr:hypothetical protein [FCB group bacterium]